MLTAAKYLQSLSAVILVLQGNKDGLRNFLKLQILTFHKLGDLCLLICRFCVANHLLDNLCCLHLNVHARYSLSWLGVIGKQFGLQKLSQFSREKHLARIGIPIFSMGGFDCHPEVFIYLSLNRECHGRNLFCVVLFPVDLAHVALMSPQKQQYDYAG